MGVRGVILAGGRGCRLGDLTRAVNKHLLPVGYEPMVYHPIKKLVGTGIVDIMLVTGPEHVGDLARACGDGNRLACNLTYRVQEEAGGVAQALGLAAGFCAGHHCAVLLGDNVFQDQFGYRADAMVYLKKVPDPERYGVATLNAGGELVAIDEKPEKPTSDYAVVGVYSYPPDVFDVIRQVKPSARGELEITDVNNHYLRAGRLRYNVMDGYWIDAGTPEALAEANRLVAQSPPRY